MNMQSAKILVGQLPNEHGIFNGGGGSVPQLKYQQGNLLGDRCIKRLTVFNHCFVVR